MADPIAGAFIGVKIGSTLFEGLMSWKASEEVAKLKGTTGANRGFTANKAGCLTLKFDIQLVQDITSTPYTPVSAGTTLENLRLYRDANDASPAFQCPTATIFTSDNGAEVEGSFTINCSGESLGEYTVNDPS